MATLRDMRHPSIEKILILQDRDSKRLSLEAQLKAIPRDVAAIEQKIAAEKAAIETARTELKELEVKKKALETEIRTNEEKLGRYKTQQLEVRKNDEFKALGLQIESAQEGIGGLEAKELEIMYAIDEAKKRFAAAEGGLKQKITDFEARILNLHTKETGVQAEAGQAREAVAAARGAVDPAGLRVYDRLATRGFPVCVAIREGKCGGCHLKVSSEVESEARKGEKLAACDQCGRIVYFES